MSLRRYAVPILLAVTINAIIIFIVLHNYSHLKHQHQRPVIVQLEKQNTAEQARQEQIWLGKRLLKHFGKVVTIDRSFKSIDNLRGFVVSFKNNPEEKSIVYADKSGKYFFIGAVFDQHGKNQTLAASSKQQAASI